MKATIQQESLYKILLSSVVSEKATGATEDSTQVVFKVARNASKPEIKAAVEKLFNVSVDDVRTLTVKGKTRRTRFGTGRRSDWKKAYVRLAEGHDIDFSMGV